MSYKWKPSKSARREFAQKMQNDVEFSESYNQRKIERAEKRRSTSLFDYNTAGGMYTPTKIQHDFAMNRPGELTHEQENACNMVISGYSCNEKIHHDYIHIVNELIRNKLTKF
jgi:hypothetical protein